MGYSLIQDVFKAPRRKLRPALLARRIAGVVIALSGATLLAGDLMRMVDGTAIQPVGTARTSP